MKNIKLEKIPSNFPDIHQRGSNAPPSGEKYPKRSIKKPFHVTCVHVHEHFLCAQGSYMTITPVIFFLQNLF